MTLFILIVVILSLLRVLRISIGLAALVLGMMFEWDYVDEYHTIASAKAKLFLSPVHIVIALSIAVWGFIILIV